VLTAVMANEWCLLREGVRFFMISEKTHLSNLYLKLDVTSRDQAVATALRSGLLQPAATWSIPRSRR
jgi:hypothetical protein